MKESIKDMSPHKIRVAFADDYVRIREILRSFLDKAPRVEMVGEASNGDEIIALCRDTTPDIVLLDLHMPGPLAPTVVQTLHQEVPHTKPLILSEEDDDVYVRAMAQLPIGGYVLKVDIADYLLEAIQVVASGGSWYSPILRPIVGLS